MSDNSLTQRHHDFCEAVARGADPAEVFRRLYSTNSKGWRANLNRLLKHAKTQERLAAIRERLGVTPPVGVAEFDAETARLIQENADAIEAAKASGNLNALVKLMAQAERLSKRAPKAKVQDAKPDLDRIATMRAVLGHKAPNPEAAKRVDELTRGHASILAYFESQFPLSPRDHARLQAEENWLREHCPNIAALSDGKR